MTIRTPTRRLIVPGAHGGLRSRVTLASVAAVIGVAAGFELQALVVVPVALLVTPLLMRRPHIIIYALSVWVPIQYWITKDLALLPARPFVWMDELLLVLLGLILVLRQLQRRDAFTGTPLDGPLLLFLICALLSAVLNRVSPVVATLGVRDNLQYAILFYALVSLPTSRRWDRHWVGIAFGVGVLQAPLALGQVMSLRNLRADQVSTGNYDLMLGTFGPSGGDFVAYFVMFLLLILLGRQLHGLKYPGWLVPILLVPFVASTSRLCFLFLPLGFLFLYGKTLRREPRRLVVPIAIAMLAFGGLLVYYWNDPAIMRMILDPREVVGSQFDFDLTYTGRAVHYPLAWWILRDFAASPLVGVGPGMYLGPTAAFFDVPMHRMYNDLFLAGSQAKFGTIDSGILTILVPFGILGFSAWCFLIARMYRIGSWLESRGIDREARSFGAAFRVMVLFVAFAALAAPVWEVQILAFYFWLFAGIAYRIARRDRGSSIASEARPG